MNIATLCSHSSRTTHCHLVPKAANVFLKVNDKTRSGKNSLTSGNIYEIILVCHI